MIRSFLVGAVCTYAAIAGTRVVVSAGDASGAAAENVAELRSLSADDVPTIAVQTTRRAQPDDAVPTADTSSDARVSFERAYRAEMADFGARRLTGAATKVYPSTSRDGLGDIVEGINLVGEDIAVNYLQPDETAHECREMCRTDAACQGWTFIENRDADGLSRCFLKGGTPTPVEDDCCSSGIRVPPVMRETGGIQYAVNYFTADLHGGGFRGEQSLAECASLCRDNEACQAYTLVLPESAQPANNAMRGSGASAVKQQNTLGGSGPMPAVTVPGAAAIRGGCWLKRYAPIPYPSGCCISGIPHPGRAQSYSEALAAAREQSETSGTSAGDAVADALLPWNWF